MRPRSIFGRLWSVADEQRAGEQCPSGQREPEAKIVESWKRHVRCADHERHEIIAEAAEHAGNDHKEHHVEPHQPGSEPIDIPETIPNPVVVPRPIPTPTEPAPKEPGTWRRFPSAASQRQTFVRLASRGQRRRGPWTSSFNHGGPSSEPQRSSTRNRPRN